MQHFHRPLPGPAKSHHTKRETFSHDEMNFNNKQIRLPSTIDKHGVHIPWDSNSINNIKSLLRKGYNEAMRYFELQKM